MKNTHIFYKPLFDHVWDSGATIHPKRDWNMLIIFFSIMLIASVFFDIFIYTQIANGGMYVSVNKNELAIETLKTDQLKSLISEFQLRQTEITTMKETSSIDPSI
jgi:hypothetical protein